MKRVVTFGEIMLRLSPPGGKRLVQAESFEATYGGGEANVAVSLAHFGLLSAYVTIVPDNALGQAAVNHLRRFGVDTTLIKRAGERLGVYFLEPGASHRPLQVVYDRAGSAISQVAPGDFDWAAIFEGAHWFHCTGITPALSDGAARQTLDACRAAKAAGLTVSCDLNYRERLWSQEKARSVMPEIVANTDVLMANLPAVDGVLGIRSRVGAGSELPTEIPAGEVCEDVARQLAERFGLSEVAITLRQSVSARKSVV